MNFIKAGALWAKEGKKGKYLSGTFELNGVKHKIIVQKNNFKKTDNHPDYQITLMQEQEQVQEQPRQEWRPPDEWKKPIDTTPVRNDELPFNDNLNTL